MTYAEFHLYFTIPQSILLWVLCYYLLDRKTLKQLFWGATTLATLAVIWTTPWDNYLIYKKIWWYGADRVLGTIGYVPIEEYFFFIIQCYFSSGFLGLLIKLSPWKLEASKNEVRFSNLLLGSCIGVFTFGVLCLFYTELFYLGLILAWALPIFLIQQFFGRIFLIRQKFHFILGILVPSIYLCICDKIAIDQEIWAISEVYTTQIKIAGLPIEEATFFFVTNWMLIQGLILFLHPQSQEIAKKVFKFNKTEPN